MSGPELRAIRESLGIDQRTAAREALGHGGGARLCHFEKGRLPLCAANIEKLIRYYRDVQVQQAAVAVRLRAGDMKLQEISERVIQCE